MQFTVHFTCEPKWEKKNNNNEKEKCELSLLVGAVRCAFFYTLTTESGASFEWMCHIKSTWHKLPPYYIRWLKYILFIVQTKMRGVRERGRCSWLFKLQNNRTNKKKWERNWINRKKANNNITKSDTSHFVRETSFAAQHHQIYSKNCHRCANASPAAAGLTIKR